MSSVQPAFFVTFAPMPDMQTLRHLWLPLIQSLLCLLFVYSFSSLCIFEHSVSVPLFLHYLPVSWSCSVPARTLTNKDYILCKVEVFKCTFEVPSDAISMLFSHCPVNSKQEQEAWHDTSLFNASGDLKPSCLLSIIQYLTLNLHHSYQLVRDGIGLHDSPVLHSVQSWKPFQSQ